MHGPRLEGRARAPSALPSPPPALPPILLQPALDFARPFPIMDEYAEPVSHAHIRPSVAGGPMNRDGDDSWDPYLGEKTRGYHKGMEVSVKDLE